MRNKVAGFLRDSTRPGDHVTVAVSGGLDSMCLLFAVLESSAELGLSVSVCHFHHGIRGSEADRDAAFVENFCHAANVPCTVGHGDVPEYARQHQMGTEEAARVLRYSFFAGMDGWLLTAHTADDNLETLLMRLLRGTGLHGLTGIPPVRGNILRPMLEVTRREVEEYARIHQIPHVEDSSNREDDYLRNRLRRNVIPLLMREAPNLPQHTAELLKTLRSEDAYLETQARELLNGAVSSEALSIQALCAMPLAMQPRVMRFFLQPVPELSRFHVERALQTAQAGGPSAILSLPGGFELRRSYDVLKLCKPSADNRSPAPVTLFPDQPVRFGPWRIVARKSTLPEAKETQIHLRLPPGPWFLRSRQPGDVIHLPGGHKKISRLMIDKKIPADRRDHLPVLTVGSSVAAILPVAADIAYRPEPGEECICICMEKMEESKLLEDLSYVMLTEEQIRDRVKEIGAELTAEYRDKQPIVLCIMKGSLVFTADLMRSMDFQCTLESITLSSYRAAATIPGDLELTRPFEVDIRGKDVIVVEDILDTGRTLHYVMGLLEAQRPASLKLVVLLDKPSRREADVEADVVGFTVPDEFVVGYGLDYDQKYRNLPCIGVLKPEIYS